MERTHDAALVAIRHDAQLDAGHGVSAERTQLLRLAELFDLDLDAGSGSSRHHAETVGGAGHPEQQGPLLETNFELVAAEVERRRATRLWQRIGERQRVAQRSCSDSGSEVGAQGDATFVLDFEWSMPARRTRAAEEGDAGEQA